MVAPSRAYEQQIFAAARESIETIYPFLPWCHPNYSIEETRTWLELCQSQWQSKHLLSFLILDTEDHLVGACELKRYEDHPSANLGYWVRKNSCGQGYASEAAAGLIQYGFKKLGLVRVEILMSTENKASQQVAAKLANYEGELKNRLVLHGRLHDCYLYGATPAPIKGL